MKIWMRIKRWLATHPLWCIVVMGQAGLFACFGALWAVLSTLAVPPNPDDQTERLLVLLLAAGTLVGWYLTSLLAAWLVGMLRGRVGLPAGEVRGWFPLVWLALVPVSSPLVYGCLILMATFGELRKDGPAGLLTCGAGGLLVAATTWVGWLRRRRRLTNTDLVLVSGAVPWLVFPLTWLAPWLIKAWGERDFRLVQVGAYGGMLLAASSVCIVLGVCLARLAWWWRESRQRGGEAGTADGSKEAAG